MVRTQLLKGEHSFRGVGFVEIDGMLHAICGSRKFDFAEGTPVRYRSEQVQQVKPEESRNAILRVQLKFDDPPEKYRLYLINSANELLRMIDNGVIDEGIPSVLVDFNGGNHQMTAPFRLRYPENWVIRESPLAGGTGVISQVAFDPLAPYLPSFTGVGDINTEIWIP